MWNMILGQMTQVSSGSEPTLSPALLCNLLTLLWGGVWTGFACAHVRWWRDHDPRHVLAGEIAMFPILLLAWAFSFVLRHAFLVGPRPDGWPWPAMLGSVCLGLTAALALGAWRSVRLLVAAILVAAFIASFSAYLGIWLIDLPGPRPSQLRPDLYRLSVVCGIMFLIGGLGMLTVIARALRTFWRHIHTSPSDTTATGSGGDADQ